MKNNNENDYIIIPAEWLLRLESMKLESPANEEQTSSRIEDM